MRILVTNDDGVDSPGILALARALHDAGHEVLVVAPADDRSGAGAAIGPVHRNEPIPVTRHDWPELPGVRVLALDRPPATAVYAACLGGFGPPPELVASGINPGANTGHLTLHSGTVGAALTAASFGVPGVALSLKWEETGFHWETAARYAPAAVEWAAAASRDDAPCVLNVNAPNRPAAEVRGVREATLARYGEVWVATADLDGGDLRMEFHGRGAEPDPQSDVALIAEGFVTVTPLAGIERAPLTGAAAALESANP